MSRLHAASSPACAGWRSQLDARRRQSAAWWAVRTPRERRMLTVGALFLALTLLWTLGLKPAIDSIARSQQQLPRLRADAAQIDTLVLEAQSLQRQGASRIDPATIPQALQTMLRRAGLEASVTVRPAKPSLNIMAAEWEVLVSDASAARLMEWLASLPSVLHVSVRTAKLSRSQVGGRDRPGQVSGHIILQGLREALP